MRPCAKSSLTELFSACEPLKKNVLNPIQKIAKSDSSKESNEVENELEKDTESDLSSSNGSHTLAHLAVTLRVGTQAVNMAGGIQKFITPPIFLTKPEDGAMD